MLVEKKVFKSMEVVEESYYLCDKCGEKILRKDYYDAFSFDFERKTGRMFEDGGHGEKWTLDLCYDCSEKAVRLLIDNGYRVQVGDWSV